MISFTEARRRVQIHVAARWRKDMGTLMTSEHGYQDPTHWWVIVGAREALVDGNEAYRVLDMPALLVDKQTGEIEELPMLTSFDRLDPMTPTEG